MLDTGSGNNALFTGEHFVLDKNRSSIGTYRCITHNGIGTAPSGTGCQLYVKYRYVYLLRHI